MQRFYRQEGELLSELSAYGDDSFFNPEFTEVDRVLAARLVQEDLAAPLAADPALLAADALEGAGSLAKEFLVKWRALQYADATWEIFDDFQSRNAVSAFVRHRWEVLVCF